MLGGGQFPVGLSRLSNKLWATTRPFGVVVEAAKLKSFL